MTVSTSRHSMPDTSPRRLHHFAAMLLAGAAIFATTDAARGQQATSISISVPGGNLSTALNALAAQAKLQIVYDAAVTRGMRTSGVSGNLPVDAALSQLLSGTGISYRVNGRTVTLSRAGVTNAAAATDADATNLEPIVVDAGGYYGNGGPGNAIIDEKVIARAQASSVPELVKRTPGVSMGGGVRLQGQTISIRGFSRQTDTRILLDGAPKNFEKYDQGNVFVEPELLKRVEIDKGATSVRYGNGGFGGTIRMESKDAKDMLRPGENWGAWGKTAYQTANKEFLETGALYGRSDFGTPVTYDGLLSLTWRKGDDMRVGGGEHYAFSDSKLANGMMKLGAEFDGHEINTSVIYGESKNWGPVAAVRGQLDIGSANPNDWEAVRRRLAWRELADFTSTFEYKYDGGSALWNPRFMASYSSTQLHATRFGDQKPLAQLGGLENDATYADIHLELENTSKFTFGHPRP